MSATCDRLHCLLLGWEYSPESISIEGGDDTVLRLPVIGILVHAPIGWVLLETGISRETAADPATGGIVYPFGAPEFPAMAIRCWKLWRHMASLPMTSRWRRPATCTSITPAACVTSRAWCPWLSSGASSSSQPPAPAWPRRTCAATTSSTRWSGSCVDGDAELTPGIDLLSTPGPHTGPHVLPGAHGLTPARGCSRWTPSTCSRASTRTAPSAGRPIRTTPPAGGIRTTDWWRWQAPRGRGWCPDTAPWYGRRWPPIPRGFASPRRLERPLRPLATMG